MEVLKCLFSYEKAGVKGRHTKAEFLRTERIKRLGGLWKNERRSERKEKPQDATKRTTSFSETNVTESTELCMDWLHYHSICPNPFPFSSVSITVSLQEGVPADRWQVLPNPHIAQVSYDLFAYQFCYRPSPRRPKIWQVSVNCLSTPPGLPMKWTLGSEMEDGLSLRI